MDLSLLATVTGRMLGVSVTPGAVLSVSERAAVVRCHTPTGTVVVKYQTGGKEMASSERVALRLLTRAGCLDVAQARIAGVSVVVLEDLGDVPTVATLLDGYDAAAAREGLVGMARAAGKVHQMGRTVQERFARGRAGPPRAAVEASQLREALRVLPTVLAPLEVEVPAGLDVLVEQAAQVLEAPGEQLGLTHGDLDPKNALCADRGVVLVDFEKAGRRHVLTDVVHWHVGPPLPAEVRAEMDAAWREAVAPAFPTLHTEEGFQAALGPLVVHRAVLTVAGMLTTLIAHDVPLESGFGGRSVLLSVLSGLTWRTGPLGELAQRVLDVVDVAWSRPMPAYRCFQEAP